MHRVFFSSRATKTGAIDTTFGSNGIPICRRLRDICGVGDRLKTVPHSANTTWILIFCRVRMGQGVPKCPTSVPLCPIFVGQNSSLPTRKRASLPTRNPTSLPTTGLFLAHFGTVAHFFVPVAHFLPTCRCRLFVAISRKSRCCPVWPTYFSIKFNLIKIKYI